MFLKNWDMTKTYLILNHEKNRSFNEDNEIYWRNYRGEYVTNARTYYLDSTILHSNGYYTDLPSDNVNSYAQFFLWPGGDCELNRRKPFPYISQNHIKYDDFNLYRPFYGSAEAGIVGDEIYGQNPVVSPAIYNEIEDKWEKTVTREFKNVSGYTIIIRELGFYQSNILMARELLDEPIIVENDGYFKMSFTYECENPHENRQEKRERLMKWPFFNHHYANSSYPLSFKPTKNKLLLGIYVSNYNISNEQLSQKDISAPGWEIELLHANIKIRDQLKQSNEEEELSNTEQISTYKSLFKIYFLTRKEDVEDNTITIPNGSGTNELDSKAYYGQYLNDDIEKLEVIDFYDNDTLEIKAEKTFEEDNLIWVVSTRRLKAGDNLTSFYLASEDTRYCDSEFIYATVKQYYTFFAESNTENLIHTFGDYRTPEDFNSISVLKLKAITKDNKPLWEDIPVQR